jgi:hypothetical protein
MGIALLFYMQTMFVPHRKHLWASTACYGHSFTLLYVDDVRTSQETPMGLHGLLWGIALRSYMQMIFVRQRKHV